MTTEQPFEHEIKQVWTWGEGRAKKFVYRCQCGYEPKTALPYDTNAHTRLRENHFEHVRRTRRRGEGAAALAVEHEG